MALHIKDQLLVDSLPVCACVFAGPEHVIIAANELMIGLWDADQTIIGKPIAEVLPELIQQGFTDDLNEAYSSEKTTLNKEGKLEIKKGGAHFVYLNYSLKALLDDEGQAYAVIATAVDITDYVLSKRKLEQAEHKQAFLLKLSDCLRPLADPGEIQKEAARILGEHLKASRIGYGDVDKLEQRWFTTEYNWTDGTVLPHHGVHDLAAFGTEVLAALRTGISLVVDDMLTDPRTALPEMQAAFNALQIRSALTVSLIKENRFVAAMYVHDRKPRHWTAEEINLTAEVAERTWAAVQRATAENSLRQSEDKFRTLFDTIDEGFCILEVLYDENNKPADLLYHLTNKAFETQTGIPSPKGKTWKSAVNNAEDSWVETYGQVVETNKAVRFENYSPALNKWFSVYASKIGGPYSRQVALVFDDITERKQHDQRKNDFISMVSHELKTPLTTLKAHLQLTNRRALNTKDSFIESSIKKSLFQVEKMQKLIQGFLDVNRLEEGKIQLNLLDFELTELIRESVEDFKLLSDTHEIVFAPTCNLTVRGDRDKLGQVINNLLSNAVKYSLKGSKVEVSCGISEKWVRVSVSDEGIGIKPEDSRQIFDRFYRAEDHLTKHISGFGIGLYLCSEIIKYHSGDIGVDSHEGRGSTFWFTLPQQN